VLGANIGTAVGSQLVAFDLHTYAPIALAAGVLLHVAGRNDRQKQIGLIVLGFGHALLRSGVSGRRYGATQRRRDVHRLDGTAREEPASRGTRRVRVHAGYSVVLGYRGSGDHHGEPRA
jgi:hypothetical protein